MRHPSFIYSLLALKLVKSVLLTVPSATDKLCNDVTIYSVITVNMERNLHIFALMLLFLKDRQVATLSLTCEILITASCPAH